MDRIYNAKELNDKTASIKTQTKDISVITDDVKLMVENIVKEETFQGNYATNVKAYYHEVHGKMLDSIKTLLEGTHSISNRLKEEALIRIDSSKTASIEVSYLKDTVTRKLDQYYSTIYDTNYVLNQIIDEHDNIVNKYVPGSHGFKRVNKDSIEIAHMNAVSKIQSGINSIDDFDNAKLVQPLNDLIGDISSLLSYSKDINKSGLSTYTPGTIESQPWFKNLNIHLDVMKMINQSALYTSDELTNMSDAHVKEIVMEVYGMDDEKLKYVADLYGYNYSNPEDQRIFLRDLLKLMNFIDRNANPKEKEFFSALVVADFVTAFNIPYDNLSVATLGLLDATILSFEKNFYETGPFKNSFDKFLQAMLMSEGEYKYSSQSLYLAHAYETVVNQQEINYAYVQNNNLVDSELKRLDNQNKWLIAATGLLGTLSFAALVDSPERKLTHTYHGQNTLTTKETINTGLKIHELSVVNGKYVWSFQYQEKDIVTTYSNVGIDEQRPNFSKIISKEVGKNRASHDGYIQSTIFINSESAEVAAGLFEKLEIINKKRNQIIENQILTTINTVGMFMGPELAIGATLLTGAYRLFKSEKLEDAKSPVGSLGSKLGKEFDSLKNSKAITDYAFDTYKNAKAYNELEEDQKKAIDEFMGLFYNRSHVEFDGYLNPITGKRVNLSRVAEGINSDIWNASNIGKLERGGLVALYGEQVKVAVDKCIQYLQPDDDDKAVSINAGEVKVLKQMIDPNGFKLEDLDVIELANVLPNLDEYLRATGLPTLADKLKEGKPKEGETE